LLRKLPFPVILFKVAQKATGFLTDVLNWIRFIKARQLELTRKALPLRLIIGPANPLGFFFNLRLLII